MYYCKWLLTYFSCCNGGNCAICAKENCCWSFTCPSFCALWPTVLRIRFENNFDCCSKCWFILSLCSLRNDSMLLIWSFWLLIIAFIAVTSIARSFIRWHISLKLLSTDVNLSLCAFVYRLDCSCYNWSFMCSVCRNSCTVSCCSSFAFFFCNCTIEVSQYVILLYRLSLYWCTSFLLFLSYLSSWRNIWWRNRFLLLAFARLSSHQTETIQSLEMAVFCLIFKNFTMVLLFDLVLISAPFFLIWEV